MTDCCGEADGIDAPDVLMALWDNVLGADADLAVVSRKLQEESGGIFYRTVFSNSD